MVFNYLKINSKFVLVALFTIIFVSIGNAQNDRIQLESSIELKSTKVDLVTYNEYRSNELYKKALNSFEIEDYNAALEKVSAAIDLDQQNAEFFHLRSQTFLAFGYYDEAVSDVKMAIHLDQKNPEFFYTRGLLNHKLKWNITAIHDLTRALHLGIKDEAKVYEARAHVYFDMKLYGKAISNCDSVIVFNPNSAKAYTMRGIAKQLDKDTEGALQDYVFALQLDPSNSDLWLNKGIVLYELQNYSEAISDFSKSLELNPNYEAYKYRGAAYIKLEKYDLARNDYRETVRFDETQPLTVARVSNYY